MSRSSSMLKTRWLLPPTLAIFFAVMAMADGDRESKSIYQYDGGDLEDYGLPEGFSFTPASSSESVTTFDAFEQYCKAGNQVRQLRESFTGTLADVPAGTPKDVALKIRKKSADLLRKAAREYFQTEEHQGLFYLKRDYTMFLPPSLQLKAGISSDEDDLYSFSVDGDCEKNCVPSPSPSKALKDRENLWQRYISKFSTLKESPAQKENTIAFEATLDLSVFCKYARAIDDLVTKPKRAISSEKEQAPTSLDMPPSLLNTDNGWSVGKGIY